jgi:hypothetical protein
MSLIQNSHELNLQAMAHVFLQEGESNFLDVVALFDPFLLPYIDNEIWFHLQHRRQWQWCGFRTCEPRELCFTLSVLLVDSPSRRLAARCTSPVKHCNVG